MRKVLRNLGKYTFICRRWSADNVRPDRRWVSEWVQITECRQTISFRQYRKVHGWSFLQWGQQNGHSDAHGLLFQTPDHQICQHRSMPWPLSRLSSHGHPQNCFNHKVFALNSLCLKMAKTSLHDKQSDKQWN